MCCAPVEGSHCSAGVGGKRAVFPSQLVEHDLKLIVELQAEPVPPDLLCGELTGTKLVVHPGLSSNLESLIVETNAPLYLQARQRVLVRGLTGLIDFLTDPHLSVNNWGLQRMSSRSIDASGDPA